MAEQMFLRDRRWIPLSQLDKTKKDKTKKDKKDNKK